MGRIEMVCEGCHEAYSEYDPSLTCVKCHLDFFDQCCSDMITAYAGVGHVCQYCDNYNSAPAARDEDLLEFMCKKHGTKRSQVYEEWSSKQKVSKLACFVCKEFCPHTDTNEVDVEVPDLDNGEEIYGMCCKCLYNKNCEK